MPYLLRRLADKNKTPRSRVELHLHLEGAARPTTIWELANQKGMKLTPNGTLDELKEFCLMKRPGKLIDCLNIIAECMHAFRGDAKSIERIAYEISEDEYNQGVLYFELRMSPQLSANTVRINDDYRVLSPNDPNACSPEQTVQSVLNGLKRGQKDFGIRSSLILCCIVGHSEFNEQVLELAQKFRDQGVVGIDFAGNEEMAEDSTHIFTDKEISMFKKAKELGIHRTCHAGEAGPAANVGFAIDEMCAERIGHGYRVINDKALYEKCLAANVHFETCPQSSYFTGAISPYQHNSIIQFAEDGANFSINKDDPLTFGSTLDLEYKYLYELGLTEAHVVRANINAAKASFLPEEEKKELLKQLYASYGLI